MPVDGEQENHNNIIIIWFHNRLSTVKIFNRFK